MWILHTLMALPWSNETLGDYRDASDLENACRVLGCSGLEICRAGEPSLPYIRPELVVGVHLPFYANWLDFWHGNRAALQHEYGSPAVWESFYGGTGREVLVALYRRELEWAQALGARYAVYHVSQVTTREAFTQHNAYTDYQVIQAAADCINLATEGLNISLEILFENLNWAGLNYRDAAITARLLELVNYPRKGLMLDVGHLMCTNPELQTQAEGCRFIHRVLDAHGELCRSIRGVHLHASLPGEYIRQALKHPPELEQEFYARFAQAYRHVQQIDTHGPLTAPEAAGLLARIQPEYVTHEVAGKTRAEREGALAAQIAALRMGGWQCC